MDWRSDAATRQHDPDYRVRPGNGHGASSMIIYTQAETELRRAEAVSFGVRPDRYHQEEPRIHRKAAARPQASTEGLWFELRFVMDLEGRQPCPMRTALPPSPAAASAARCAMRSTRRRPSRASAIAACARRRSATILRRSPACRSAISPGRGASPASSRARSSSSAASAATAARHCSSATSSRTASRFRSAASTSRAGQAGRASSASRAGCRLGLRSQPSDRISRVLSDDSRQFHWARSSFGT